MEWLLTDIALPLVATIVTTLIGLIVPPAINFLKSNMSKAKAEEMESHMRQFESVVYDAIDTVEDELRARLEKADFTTDSEVVNMASRFVNANAPIVMENLQLSQEYVEKKVETLIKRLVRDLKKEKQQEAAALASTGK